MMRPRQFLVSLAGGTILLAGCGGAHHQSSPPTYLTPAQALKAPWTDTQLRCVHGRCWTHTIVGCTIGGGQCWVGAQNPMITAWRLSGHGFPRPKGAPPRPAPPPPPLTMRTVLPGQKLEDCALVVGAWAPGHKYSWTPISCDAWQVNP